MRKHIKITVILPVYNAEKHIQKCIDSILHQHIEPIEIIVVNDCSTDNSLEKLNKYNEHQPTLNIINHQTNMGAGAARNNAIKKARGKYITFIDSDDWFGPNYLNSLYIEAEKTNSDIVFSNSMIVNQNNENKRSDIQGIINKYSNSSVSLIDFPNEWRPTAPWMKLYRKEFILKNKLKFLEGIKLGAEDIPFSWISYFRANKISFCENTYYFYNHIPESLDRFVNESITEIFDALNFTKVEYQRFDPHHIRYAQLDTLYVSHAFYQFSKIINKGTMNNMKVASLFWTEAHRHLIHILPKNIIENKFLSENEKEYYFDVIRAPGFNIDMQNKYS